MYRLKKRAIVSAALSAWAMSSASVSQATVYFQLTLLGTIGDDTADNGSAATAINDSGVIVGSYGTGQGYGTVLGYGTPGQQAFIWTPASANGISGSMAELPELPNQSNAAPNSISNSGTIAGQYQLTTSTYPHAGGLIWTGSAHTPQTLGFSSGATYKSFVVNNSGTVAGWSYTDSGGYGNAVWQNGVFVNQLTNNQSDIAGGINDAGQFPASVGNEAAIFDSSSQNPPTLLGFLDNDTNSTATAINSHGQATGYSGEYKGFIWTPSSPNGQTGSLTAIPLTAPQGINDSGTVIGNASGPAYWSVTGGVRDLAGDIGDEQVGYTLDDALGINNVGQIVGDLYETFGDTQVKRAFLATPLATPQAAVGHWLGYGGGGNGQWSRLTQGSWTASAPRDAGDTAIFGDQGSNGGGSVSLQDNLTVGHIILQDPNDNPLNGYQFSGPDGETLTIDNRAAWATGVASINVVSGTHIEDANLVVPAGATITVADGSQLTLSGNLSGGTVITKAGPGVLTMGRANSQMGFTVVVAEGFAVTQGMLEISSARTPAASGYGPYVVPSLSISASGLVVLDATGSLGEYYGEPQTVFDTNSLTFNSSPGSTTGRLDLQNNGLIVRAGDAAKISAALFSGLHNGAWDGPGIMSGAAAADTTGLTAVGMLQNGDGFTLGTFLGQSVAAGDLLLKLTYFGDANLDGNVDGSDYSRIDSGYISKASGWDNGDFNYDGIINGSDYTLIDNAFNNQGAAFTTETASPSASVTTEIAGNASVPEPTSILALGILSMAGTLRRRW